jgi:hypothetical protein
MDESLDILLSERNQVNCLNHLDETSRIGTPVRDRQQASVFQGLEVGEKGVTVE